MERFRRCNHTRKKLYIVGGILMIDPHYAFLRKCIDADRAKNIVVEYNSNITNIPAGMGYLERI